MIQLNNEISKITIIYQIKKINKKNLKMHLPLTKENRNITLEKVKIIILVIFV